MIKFACFSPHPPLLLPNVGSHVDREKVKKTIESLEFLGRKLKEVKPDTIIISSPHPNWGFEVPLYFLAKNFKGEIKTFLTDFESPTFWFEKGKELIKDPTFQCLRSGLKQKKYAVIASGDMSHCLKEEGPYGFHPDGPKFDKALIKYLEKKDIKNFLKLDEMYPDAGECGLRSFSFILGILEASNSAGSGHAGIDWQPEILSYESPFGVGYLVVNFKLE